MLVPIPVGELATHEIETVDPDTTLREAARHLRAAEVGSLVVMVGDEPAGILTRDDLTNSVADDLNLDTTGVSEVMTVPLITVDVDDDIETAASRAREYGIKKLPVVDGDDLVGIVTTTDLSYYLPEFGQGFEWGPADGDDEGMVRLDVHSETAYERDDWIFEYIAPEGNVEGKVEVGDVARFSKTISDEDVREFADATGDTNRLHLEEEFARETRFGHRIAHGTLTAGVLSAALARLPGLTIFLSKELHFEGPVEIDERIVAICEVTEDLGRNKFRLSVTVRDSDGEVVVSGSATVLIDELPALEATAADPSETARSD